MRATSLLFRGQRELRAGNAGKAAALLGQAAEAAPDSPHVALHHALARADAGEIDQALADLDSGARRWPTNPVFYLFRGALLIEQGRLDEGEGALTLARQLSPENRLIDAYQGLAAMKRGETERALRRLAAVGYSDNPRALAAILAEVEAELFRRCGTDSDAAPPRRDDPPPLGRWTQRKSARRLAAMGLDRLEHGDPVRAWQVLTLAAEKDPSQPEVFVYLGCACFDLGEHEQALEFFGRVGEWSKALDMVHVHRGAALYKLGRFDEALEALAAAREADELGNFRTWIHFYRGRALVALGRTAEAIGGFRRFIELEGDLAVARLGQARELLGLAVPETAPKGFEVVESGRGTMVVKPAVREALEAGEPPADGAPAKAGRAPMDRVALPDGVALVRHCRRGGLLGKLLGGLYLDGNRFLRELAVADALCRRGVPTPEPLAGIRREVVPGVYRADVVVREVPDAVDLAAALRGDGSRKGELLAASARLLRQAHDAGLDHPDLNARNILIAADRSAMILDLDRAELVDELSMTARLAMLSRLYRSLHKLGLAPEPVGDDDWRAFYDAYADGDATLLGQADRLLGRCHRELARHRFWWRLTGGGPADAKSRMPDAR